MAKKKIKYNQTNQKDNSIISIKNNSEQSKEMMNNLRALYNHTYDETKHFRTFEWQITVWSTTLIGAIISVTKLFTPNPNEQLLFKILLSSFTLIFASSAIFHVIHCHKSLTSNRKMMNRLENIFGFNNMTIDGTTEKLFPDKFVKKPTMLRGWFHLVTWILTIVAVSCLALNRIYAW